MTVAIVLRMTTLAGAAYAIRALPDLRFRITSERLGHLDPWMFRSLKPRLVPGLSLLSTYRRAPKRAASLSHQGPFNRAQETDHGDTPLAARRLEPRA